MWDGDFTSWSEDMLIKEYIFLKNKENSLSSRQLMQLEKIKNILHEKKVRRATTDNLR